MRHFLAWAGRRSLSLAGDRECRMGSGVRRPVMNTAKRNGYVALLLLLILLAAGPSLRAAEKSDWGNLKQVAPGKTSRFITTRRKSRYGLLASTTIFRFAARWGGGTDTKPRE